MVETLQINKPTPKRLILSLLSARSIDRIQIGRLIKWGHLFDIDAAATRVALGRLVKQGFIQSVSRGFYSIGPEGKLISETARNWVLAETRIGPWDGAWIAVHTSHLGRTNKTALRARERAFRLNGFAELVTGLWCRPGNYLEPVAQTRKQLVSLGLEEAAVVMPVTGILGVPEQELFQLWPRDRLEAQYAAYTRMMQDSSAHLAQLSPEDAARETFLIGEAVIRQINADPFLPDEMVDGDARREMILQMKRYDALGEDSWRIFQA